MHVLIMKDYDARISVLEKFDAKDYCYPTLELAEERGNSILTGTLKREKYNFVAFHTMELNNFITTFTDRYGLGVSGGQE